MKYQCQKVLLEDNFTPLDLAAEAEHTRILIEIIKSKKDKVQEEFLLAFIWRTQNASLIQSLGRLLQLLVGDAPKKKICCTI